MTGTRRIVGTASAAALVMAIGAAPAHAEPAVALLPGNQLVSFDTATPGTISTVPVTGLGANQTLRCIDFRPTTGELMGVAVTTGSAANSVVFVYRIEPATGVATAVGASAAAIAGAADVPTGADFNPAISGGFPIDRIRVVNTNDESVRMNPNNGTLAGNDTDLNPAATTDVTAVAYDRNTGQDTKTTLFAIDRNASTMSIIGGPDSSSPSANAGVTTDITPLGVALTAGSDAGLDITPAGTMFAALTVGGVTGLYAFNPGTTLVGAIGNGATQVYGLAIAPPDGDGDGTRDAADNCPAAANADQADLDFDDAGDVCDSDQDGDGLSDAVEQAIGSNPRSTDSDGDGAVDSADACPALAGGQQNGCPDVTLPDTAITKAPKRKSTKRKATVEFTSSEPGSTFACSLDHKPFVPCASPFTYKRLKVGRHFVDVRAIDAANNLDPTPATAAWQVKPKRKN